MLRDTTANLLFLSAPVTLDTALALPSIERMTPDERIAALGIPGAMLHALATMARLSLRNAAEMQVALHRAGLPLSDAEQEAALGSLCKDGSVQDVIPLDDGGTLISVTSAGMQRACDQSAV